MARWGVLAAVVVLTGAVLVGRAAVPRDPQQPAEAKPAAEQKIGNFQMPRVLREYKWAAKQFKPLEDCRSRMTPNVARRKRYIELHQELQSGGNLPLTLKETKTRELLTLAQKIDAENATVNALLTEAAALLAAEVNNHIRAEVAELAKERGLIALVAYPVTPEELLGSLQVKQLKLKPPPAQPFYLHPSVDYTDALIQRLNAKFAADGGK